MTHLIDVNGAARRIEAEAGISLLEALAREGIFLPTICGGRGLCGRCRLKVLGGAAPTAAERKKLSAAQLADGVRLACQVPVDRDLSIELPDDLLAAGRFRGSVEAIGDLTHDIKGVRIALISPARISFTPGQYIRLDVPASAAGREGLCRPYTLANEPRDDGHVELMIRLVPGGVSTGWVFNELRAGDEVTFTGPHGDFGLSDADGEMVWVAGGSGMSPFWSMLRHMRSEGLARECTYFFGAVQRRDLFLTDELAAMAEQLDWFSFVPALSAPADGDGWDGETGLITEVLARRIPDGSGLEGYICGSPAMVDAAVAALRRSGVAADRIFYERLAPAARSG